MNIPLEAIKDHNFVSFYDLDFCKPSSRIYDSLFFNYKCRKCGLVLRIYKNMNDWTQNSFNEKSLNQGFFTSWGWPITWAESYELQEFSCAEIMIKNIIE